MKAAIRFVWWIGLVGALIATLAILKEVALVVRVLRGIHVLSELTRDAARGVAANLAGIDALANLETEARALRRASADLAKHTASIEQRLSTIAAAPTPRGG